MTKRVIVPILWIVLVGLLLGGAFIIVQRNAPSGVGDAAGYLH
jgi:hypothetical protein